ncbi:cystatin-A5-like [Sycon ciliatum]|uniref:cystatin-A5-like n=1 Tax=Sycon ciliatum TaxID=27933 RepID=UPI0031F656F3
MEQSAQLMGGWSHPPQEANLGVQEICNQVRKAVEDKINGGKQFGQFVAKFYIKQVVAGMNYRIRVQINDVSLIRIEVFQNLLLDGVQAAPVLGEVAADGPLNSKPF